MANKKFFPPLAALRAFEAAGRLGGIRKAAKELEIDHAVVSRHIRALETWMGNTLLVRDGAGYHLTDAGALYHGEISKAIAIIGNATTARMQASEQLPLRIWCVPGLASLWLLKDLGQFIADNHDIDMDFRPSDNVPDFRANDVDGDIRYLRIWEEKTLPKTVHRLEFARPLVFPVASPQLAASIGNFKTANDLLNFTILHEDSDLEWRFWLEAQGVEPLEHLAGPRLWHAHLTIDAAKQGRGIALANPLLLQDDLGTSINPVI